MKKIISLFQRNYETDRLVRDEVVPGAEWVLAGEGIATRKYDGTCCMIRDGQLFKRYEAKKPPPDDFIPAQDPDPVTGHWVGWRPCDRNDKSDRYHFEAFDALEHKFDGTYELIGPKVQKNPEKVDCHVLRSHRHMDILFDCPRDFESIKAYLADKDIEGVVWHWDLNRSDVPPETRMVKIKKKDFGLKR